MSPSTSTPVSAKKLPGFPTILAAGLLAGVLDITAAFVTWVPRGVPAIIIPQGIASGLLGAKSFNGGMRTAALGMALHFLIALSAAAMFYAASRKLSFMTRRPMVAGALYGVVVYVCMYWVVMPLSNFQRGPFSVFNTVIAIITHILCIGLPISLVVRRYSR
jgi:uncharacterized membrane protein YagU involved in acid resistance